MEKARLYCTLDTLLHRPRCTIASLRITKAKLYSGRNPNGLERHFSIERGHKITPLTDWQYMNSRQRAAWVTKHEHDMGRLNG